jgi:hypothetical protein
MLSHPVTAKTGRSRRVQIERNRPWQSRRRTLLLSDAWLP